MKYDKNKTKNSFLSKDFPNCLKDYNLIIFEEDESLTERPKYFDNVSVMDLDCVEVILAQEENRRQNKTMDTAFIISDRLKEEILFVELRFNYKSMRNLKKSDLIDKVSGSKNIINDRIKVNTDYIFIFQPNLVQQAYNRIYRMNPGLPNNYKIMDLTQLINNYF